MKLIPAEAPHIPDIVRMSKAAFESDISVGSPKAGGPPEYESERWYTEMMQSGRLYAAFSEDKLVGAAVLFCDHPSFVYVGRIFIDPAEFRKGYGTELMLQIENLYPEAKAFGLDTPVWNQRTRCFYTKLGYQESRRDAELIYYQKSR